METAKGSGGGAGMGEVEDAMDDAGTTVTVSDGDEAAAGTPA
jgi:hypothetical protein